MILGLSIGGVGLSIGGVGTLEGLYEGSGPSHFRHEGPRGPGAKLEVLNLRHSGSQVCRLNMKHL